MFVNIISKKSDILVNPLVVSNFLCNFALSKKLDIYNMVDLKKVIRRYNVTQTELAVRWGVYQSAVSQMLGGGKISLEKLYDLADACNCTVSDLVADTEPLDRPAALTCPKCGAKLTIDIKASEQ